MKLLPSRKACEILGIHSNTLRRWDSPVLNDLLEYEKHGLKIMVCGTCLTYFNLLDAKKVGETTNMLDIVTAMQLADKVIKI